MVCLSVEAVLAKTLTTSDNQVTAAFDAALNKQSAGSVYSSQLRREGPRFWATTQILTACFDKQATSDFAAPVPPVALFPVSCQLFHDRVVIGSPARHRQGRLFEFGPPTFVGATKAGDMGSGRHARG